MVPKIRFDLAKEYSTGPNRHRDQNETETSDTLK